MLFGLFLDNQRYLNLLVINMQESSCNVMFSIDHNVELSDLTPVNPSDPASHYTYRCDKITRMFHGEDFQLIVDTNYTTILINNMLGGECAILRLKPVS